MRIYMLLFSFVLFSCNEVRRINLERWTLHPDSFSMILTSQAASRVECPGDRRQGKLVCCNACIKTLQKA